MQRRDFLRLGALFVPAVAAPTVAYSFLWAKPERYVWEPVLDDRRLDYCEDLWIDADGNVQHIKALNVGELIARSIRITIDEARRQRVLALEGIVIKGTVRV